MLLRKESFNCDNDLVLSSFCQGSLKGPVCPLGVGDTQASAGFAEEGAPAGTCVWRQTAELWTSLLQSCCWASGHGETREPKPRRQWASCHVVL